MSASGSPSAALQSIWPIFGLRVRARHLLLKLPTDSELAALAELAADGVHDPDYAPFSYMWTDRPPGDLQTDFLKFHWNARAQFHPSKWSLQLGVFVDGDPIGVQQINAERFDVLRAATLGNWVGLRYQNQGYTLEMASAAVDLCFHGLQAEVIYASTLLDNSRMLAIAHRLGFEKDGLLRVAPRREALWMQGFRLHRKSWESLDRPRAEVDGLEASLPLFGINSD
jgi:RimJ/RimL family protein N-acetyltransferase